MGGYHILAATEVLFFIFFILFSFSLKGAKGGGLVGGCESGRWRTFGGSEDLISLWSAWEISNRWGAHARSGLGGKERTIGREALAERNDIASGTGQWRVIARSTRKGRKEMAELWMTPCFFGRPESLGGPFLKKHQYSCGLLFLSLYRDSSCVYECVWVVSWSDYHHMDSRTSSVPNAATRRVSLS